MANVSIWGQITGNEAQIRELPLREGEVEVRKLVSFNLGIPGRGRDGEWTFFEVTVWLSSYESSTTPRERDGAVPWEETRDTIEQYLHRGRRVMVEGDLRSRGWKTPDDEKRKVLTISVNGLRNVQFDRFATKEAYQAGQVPTEADVDDDIPF